MVESPAGSTALPRANPLREHGNKTVPLAQLLLGHRELILTPDRCRIPAIFANGLHSRHTSLPRIIHPNMERRSEAWPVLPGLLRGKQNPGTSADASLLCFLLLWKRWFSLGAGWRARGGVGTHSIAPGLCGEPGFGAPALILVPNPMLLCPEGGCVARLVKWVNASLDSDTSMAWTAQNKQNSSLD